MRTKQQNAIAVAPVAFCAAVALAGCVQFAQPRLNETVTSSESQLPEQAGLLSLEASVSDASIVREAPTSSNALDRITKRTLPLDHIYRHRGTGRGVTVYVFDGGISMTHPELAGRVRIGYSEYPTDPPICNAHGTAVAGAIAGSTLGVAPEAKIVDVKMLQCSSLRGSIKGIVDGAHWVAHDHVLRGGPAVANWSFLADSAADIPALDSAVTLLRSVGISVIVSAGNLDMNACNASPADADGTIVVGAATITTDTVNGHLVPVDRRSPGTAWGPCIDLFAPGDSVLLPSLDANMAPITQHWFGTSMATGYVSGAAALYLEAHPKAKPDDVGDFLRNNATVSVIHDGLNGFGRMLYVGPAGKRTDSLSMIGFDELLARSMAARPPGENN
jgi:hypothetical protein